MPHDDYVALHNFRLQSAKSTPICCTATKEFVFMAQSKADPKAPKAAQPADAPEQVKDEAVAKDVKPAPAGPVQTNQTVQDDIVQGAVEMATKTNTASAFDADQFKNAFGDVNERAKVAFEKGAKLVEEFADLTRGNVEAFVASSKVAAKGVETLSQDAAEFGRKSFDEASAAFRGFADAKTATDFFKLQGDFARSAFDAAVAESARVSEAMLKIAGEVAEPITSRYAVAAERVKSLAA
jgi:phasin family protein